MKFRVKVKDIQEKMLLGTFFKSDFLTLEGEAVEERTRNINCECSKDINVGLCRNHWIVAPKNDCCEKCKCGMENPQDRICHEHGDCPCHKREEKTDPIGGKLYEGAPPYLRPSKPKIDEEELERLAIIITRKVLSKIDRENERNG